MSALPAPAVSGIHSLGESPEERQSTVSKLSREATPMDSRNLNCIDIRTQPCDASPSIAWKNSNKAAI